MSMTVIEPNFVILPDLTLWNLCFFPFVYEELIIWNLIQKALESMQAFHLLQQILVDISN